MRPMAPDSFAYARIEVPDVDATTAFYERYVGLEVVRRVGDHVMLRAGTLHHAIELVPGPGPEGVTRAFGFTMAGASDLADLRRRVDEAGLAARPLPSSLDGLVMDGFAVDDPNGITFEFVEGFQEFAEPPFLAFHPERVMHPFIVTPKYHDTLRFATEVVGFQVSDYIADMTAFVRGENRYHHALAILESEAFTINHVNFLMPSLDHVMRARARILYEGVPIKMDLVKHSASTTIAFYFQVPEHGPPIELSYGHRIFTPAEHESHRPRRMAQGARNELDLWRSSDDDWREVH
ncbi:MAG: VOC family protein [Acidimicrobiia bacterium]